MSEHSGEFHSCAVEDVYLGYTGNDDGVHLFCHRCTWDHNLGFNATAADAAAVVAAHITRPSCGSCGWSGRRCLTTPSRSRAGGCSDPWHGADITSSEATDG